MRHVKIHHLLPLAGARSIFPSLSKGLNPFTDFYNLPLQVAHQASQFPTLLRRNSEVRVRSTRASYQCQERGH
jgi:hypothetical protein